ncbi:MAG: class I SAM-dependent methyltransferase [Ilumatobacteraceae bacterium]
MGDQLWEDNADWWIEGFTEGADPEYEEQIVPMAVSDLAGFRKILDVGCGDGQIGRALARAHGCHVVGIDPTWNQIRVAKERSDREQGASMSVARAGADRLPFGNGSFDAVVACLVFEHIREVDSAIGEVARVLRPGGRFSFFLNHPLLQTPGSGWIDDQVLDPPEQYWRIGPYLIEEESIEEVEKDVFIPFIHRPLSRYVGALVHSGFVITGLDEPAPPRGFLARAFEYEAAATIPRLLHIQAEKR